MSWCSCRVPENATMAISDAATGLGAQHHFMDAQQTGLAQGRSLPIRLPPPGRDARNRRCRATAFTVWRLSPAGIAVRTSRACSVLIT